MQPINPYKQLFSDWPSALPRRGIVVNQLNDAITFNGFMVKDNLLLLERSTPDAMGGRLVMLEYESIAAVKLVDPLRTETFKPMGFEGKLSGG